MPDLEQNIHKLVQEVTTPNHHRYAKFIRSGDRIWYDARREALHKRMIIEAGMKPGEIEDSGRLRVRISSTKTLLDVYGISADLPVPTLEQRNSTLELAARVVRGTGIDLFKAKLENDLDLYTK